MFKNRYNIALWAWELDVLPEEWKEASMFFDEIWTISDFCKNIFQSELKKEIRVVRVFPYWVKKINKTLSRKKLSIKSGEFIFLFIADYYSDLFRKNVKDLIDCFQEEFSEDEKVSLILKIRNLPEDFDLGIKSKKIILKKESTLEEENNYLMNSCDCYISLHRSEGYGLTVIESILLEKPVICTNFSGIKDFCDPKYQELIDFDLVDVHKESYYHKSLTYDNKQLKWAQPNLIDAKNSMRKVFENKKEFKKRAIKYKKKVLNYDIFKLNFL